MSATTPTKRRKYTIKPGIYYGAGKVVEFRGKNVLELEWIESDETKERAQGARFVPLNLGRYLDVKDPMLFTIKRDSVHKCKIIDAEPMPEPKRQDPEEVDRLARQIARTLAKDPDLMREIAKRMLASGTKVKP